MENTAVMHGTSGKEDLYLVTMGEGQRIELSPCQRLILIEKEEELEGHIATVQQRAEKQVQRLIEKHHGVVCQTLFDSSIPCRFDSDNQG